MIATGQKTKDPVCGMDVDEKSAAGTIQHLGQSYSFCSQRCLEKFRADPSGFVKPHASTPSATKAEPVAHASPAAKVEYVCPMHPQIVRSEPGSCPICGMALEPRTITADEKENPELRDMTRRFWVSLGLTIPVLLAAMSEFIPGNPCISSRRRASGLGSSSSWRAPWFYGAAGRSSFAAGSRS